MRPTHAQGDCTPCDCVRCVRRSSRQKSSSQAARRGLNRPLQTMSEEDLRNRESGAESGTSREGTNEEHGRGGGDLTLSWAGLASLAESAIEKGTCITLSATADGR